MSSLNPLITAAVFIPFTLLTLYYLQSIMRRTVQERGELTTWTDHLYFAGLVLFQIVIVVVFGWLTYVVIEIKFGL